MFNQTQNPTQAPKSLQQRWSGLVCCSTTLFAASVFHSVTARSAQHVYPWWPWPWPLTLTLKLKLVRATNQTRLPCEFGTNPFSSSWDIWFTNKKQTKLEMWANAQPDGRPAEYRWCPLFNAAKFGWRPLLQCRAVTLPRRDTRWNMMGCPKPANWSQLLVDRSSPYCEDMWRRYGCLTSFFPIVNMCFSCEDIAW